MAAPVVAAKVAAGILKDKDGRKFILNIVTFIVCLIAIIIGVITYILSAPINIIKSFFTGESYSHYEELVDAAERGGLMVEFGNGGQLLEEVSFTGTLADDKISINISGGVKAQGVSGSVSKGQYTAKAVAAAVSLPLPPVPPASLKHQSSMPQLVQANYRIVVAKNSAQYTLNQKMSTDDEGFRRYHTRYAVAMGTYYHNGVGDTLSVTFKQEDGTEQKIGVIIGDVKSDQHTDSTHRYHVSDGSVVEFIMATRPLAVSNVADKAFGTITKIEKDSGDIKLSGEIKKDSFTVTGTADGIPISGSGTITGGKLSGSGYFGEGASLAGATKYTGGKMLWPAPGYKAITSNFGYRIHPVTKIKSLHAGLDIGCPAGATLVAAASGKVQFAGSSRSSYGTYVIIDHGSGVYTRYAHMSAVSVTAGDAVATGTKIGSSGATGRVTGPHLHFEVMIGGIGTSYAVNPKKYL